MDIQIPAPPEHIVGAIGMGGCEPACFEHHPPHSSATHLSNSRKADLEALDVWPTCKLALGGPRQPGIRLVASSWLAGDRGLFDHHVAPAGPQSAIADPMVQKQRREQQDAHTASHMGRRGPSKVGKPAAAELCRPPVARDARLRSGQPTDQFAIALNKGPDGGRWLPAIFADAD